MLQHRSGFFMVCVCALAVVFACNKKPKTISPAVSGLNLKDTIIVDKPEDHRLYAVAVAKEVKVKHYFPFLDQIVRQYDSLVPYHLTEHLLVRFNPWIIDTLAEMDYYRRMQKGEFVKDQRQLPVFYPGDTLYIPDSIAAATLQRAIDSTWLDINIPEFRLRVVKGASDTLFTFPVRVGKSKRQFQEVLGKKVDLRTRPGEGRIIKINRDPPWFIDPHTGEKFLSTKRDDGRRTRMPLIPWLEPEINGQRLGQLIHPTTNPGSLNRAASNGCIGCSEAAAWYIYYHAPVGTRVRIRYDLELPQTNGDTVRLEDVYGLGKGG